MTLSQARTKSRTSFSEIDALPQREAVRRWWEEALNGEQQVGIAPAFMFGFIRIAAHAVEYGAEVFSNDADIGRFDGVRWVNPLT